jgi:hypothetical protein
MRSLQPGVEHAFDAGHFTAIEPLQRRYAGFSTGQREGRRLSLVGNIANSDNKPKVHAHVILGKADGAALGGHLMEARGARHWRWLSWNLPNNLQRRTDKESGLVFIHIGWRNGV